MMNELIRNEPAMKWGIVGSLVVVLVGLLKAFVPLTPDQEAAVNDLFWVILPLVPSLLTWMVRREVSPAWKVPAIDPATTGLEEA